MGGDGRKYFQDWQGTVSSITNPSLRKKAQKRLDSARDSYDKVEATLKEASDEFKPFISDLSDIQKALASDVTPGGVDAIRSVVSSANKNHKTVNETINKALKELEKMAKSLSSHAG
jgi:gas vesicle protein